MNRKRNLAYMLGHPFCVLSQRIISREVGIIRVMDITAKQKAIMFGSLLGDAWAENGSFRFKQSKEKIDYVWWMFNELKSLCRSKPHQGWNEQVSFQTTKHKEISEIENLFYPKGKKCVPKTITNLLKDPLSIAVWFMDDGTLDYRIKDHYAFRIATYSFSKKENELLVAVLNQNFGIAATVQQSKMRDKIYHRLHIGEEGRDKFLNLITPFMQPCFAHKLPPIIFNPSETRPLMVG